MADKEYIEREELYRRIKERTNPYGKPTLDYKSGVKVLDMIEQAPAADVVEVRHGRWNYINGDVGYTEVECSECKKRTVFGDEDEIYPYCPNCGAKMDGERKEYELQIM